MGVGELRGMNAAAKNAGLLGNLRYPPHLLQLPDSAIGFTLVGLLQVCRLVCKPRSLAFVR